MEYDPDHQIRPLVRVLTVLAGLGTSREPAMALSNKGHRDLVSIDVRDAYFHASGTDGRNAEDRTGSGHAD